MRGVAWIMDRSFLFNKRKVLPKNSYQTKISIKNRTMTRTVIHIGPARCASKAKKKRRKLQNTF